MQNPRQVSLLTSGQDQILTIPHDLALSVTEVWLRKEGDRLIIESIPSIPPRSLLSLLMELPDISDEFPDIDEDLLPLDEIIL